MNLDAIKIVTDSSADILSLSQLPLEVAPLKIITADKEYTDDIHLDVDRMVDELGTYRGRSSTSCPNPEDWLRAFGEAEFVFCVTITGTLSGSYNAASVAKKLYEEAHPDRHVFVLDSLSTGPEMALLLEAIEEWALSGMDFDTVCRRVTEYHQKTGLLFMLESMRNLANNGRVSPIVAKMAGLLGIRVLGKASDRGDLEPLHKCRGEKKTLETTVEVLQKEGLKTGRVYIAHCQNSTAAEVLRQKLLAALPEVKIKMYACRGLCSFYAERGGLLVGFEKF